MRNEDITSTFNVDERRKILVCAYYGDIDLPVISYSDIVNIKYLEYSQPTTVIRLSETLIEIAGMQFQKIPNYMFYYISASGVIYSEFYNRILSHKLSPKSYWSIGIVNTNKIRTFVQVHRLVYYTWSGISPNSDMEINHRDGRSYNNHLSNLEEVTPLENSRHSMYILGNKHFVFNEEIVEIVCQMMCKGMHLNDVYPHLQDMGINVDRVAVRELMHHLSRKTKFWKDISEKYDFSKYLNTRYTYPRDTIHKICKDLESGFHPAQLVSKYNASLKFISALKNHSTHKDITSQYNMPLIDYRKSKVKNSKLLE